MNTSPPELPEEPLAAAPAAGALASRFREPHAGDADDDATWEILVALADAAP